MSEFDRLQNPIACSYYWVSSNMGKWIHNSTDCLEMLTTCVLFSTDEVAVIDEIQMLRDATRGWAWTRALLGECNTVDHGYCMRLNE